MSRMQKTTRIFAFMALVFILVGCSSPTAVVQPTQDVNPIRTEAAQTVVAKLTIEAALNPTATTQPTAEPVVLTATLAPSPTATQAVATLAPTATLIPTNRPGTSGTGGGAAVYPTRTPQRPDAAILVSQEPTDGTKIGPGVEFDGKWVLKNIGTTTWSTGYEYRTPGGDDDPLSMKNIYTLPSSVKPGESVTIYADMKAPSEGGRYTSQWELVNENGEIFFRFFMVINVE